MFSTHQNWFTGFGNVPTTDNALESFNNLIKGTVTLRKLVPLNQFLVQLDDAMVIWSKASKYLTEPDLTISNNLELWTSACQWVKEKVKLKYKDMGGDLLYNVPTDFFSYPTNVEMSYRQDWKSFQDFKDRNFKMYKTTIPLLSSWKTGACTCQDYLKCFICKHIIGISIIRKIAIPPMTAWNVPIGQKRKRGRPTTLPGSCALMRL